MYNERNIVCTPRGVANVLVYEIMKFAHVHQMSLYHYHQSLFHLMNLQIHLKMHVLLEINHYHYFSKCHYFYFLLYICFDYLNYLSYYWSALPTNVSLFSSALISGNENKAQVSDHLGRLLFSHRMCTRRSG